MKVLHLDSEINYGGGQRQLFNLLKTLKDNNISQIVACSELSKINKLSNSISIPTRNINLRKIFNFSSFYKLKNLIDEFSPDIVHCHTSKSLSFVLFLRLIITKRKIFYINTRRVSFPINGFFSKLKYLYGADLHVCVSDSVKFQLRKLGVKKKMLEVINSGVEIPNEINKLDARKKIGKFISLSENDIIIGSSGNLLPVKRFDWLINAVYKNLKENSDIKLVIFGGGDLYHALKKQINTLNIQDKVYLFGHVEKPERYFPGLDIFCMPSELEGLSGSVMDAMANKVAILGTDTSGINDLISNNINGILFKLSSIDDLSNKLSILIRDKKLRSFLAEKGHESVAKRYSIETTTKQYLKLYKKALKN